MRCAFPWNESKKNWKMNTTLDKRAKKKKQKEMLKRKLDMKKIKIDIPFRLTLERPRTDCSINLLKAIYTPPLSIHRS